MVSWDFGNSGNQPTWCPGILEILEINQHGVLQINQHGVLEIVEITQHGVLGSWKYWKLINMVSWVRGNSGNHPTWCPGILEIVEINQHGVLGSWK